MLITTRRKGDTVDLYIPGVGRVRIEIMDVEDGKVRIAIDAPREVEIKHDGTKNNRRDQ